MIMLIVISFGRPGRANARADEEPRDETVYPRFSEAARFRGADSRVVSLARARSGFTFTAENGGATTPTAAGNRPTSVSIPSNDRSRER